jgi:hypothetical protein
MMASVKISREQLAHRFAEADRRIVLLRRATRDMQAVRDYLLAERRREPGRPHRDGARRG